jgi:hypothetical protein
LTSAIENSPGVASMQCAPAAEPLEDDVALAREVARDDGLVQRVERARPRERARLSTGS